MIDLAIENTYTWPLRRAFHDIRKSFEAMLASISSRDAFVTKTEQLEYGKELAAAGDSLVFEVLSRILKLSKQSDLHITFDPLKPKATEVINNIGRRNPDITDQVR